MIDRTQEDMNQDVKIDALQHHVGVLESDVNELKAQLGEHKDRLDVLDPLTVLIEHIDAIKHFIAQITQRKK